MTSMEEIYRHFKDPDGEAAINGAVAQQMFRETFENAGFKVSKSTKYDDKYNHKDYYISKDGLTLSTDVKYPKKITRRDLYPSKEWVWVEFTGTTGYPGWLYGKQDTVSFLKPNLKEFMIVNRDDLRKLCERICSKEKVEEAEKAMYKLYTRSKYGEKDEISLIRYKDIEENCFYTIMPVTK